MVRDILFFKKKRFLALKNQEKIYIGPRKKTKQSGPEIYKFLTLTAGENINPFFVSGQKRIGPKQNTKWSAPSKHAHILVT